MTSFTTPLSALFIPVVLTACQAQYTDLRSQSERLSSAQQGQSEFTVEDAGDCSAIATGRFTGLRNYEVSGGVTLEACAVGYKLRFDSDFDSDSIPGPVVLLSTRDDVTNDISPERGDVELGELTSRGGEQEYFGTVGDPNGFTRAWVYCKPFTVAVGVATIQ